ncbi:MAG: hypothetical protein DMG62_22730 [Acidobacteria bacterium]|nr:MAG: hypothetical protein DMG62_22730 [Acidobacteriota bacterium]
MSYAYNEQESFWIFKNLNVFYWIFENLHVFYWIFKNLNVFYGIFENLNVFYWIFEKISFSVLKQLIDNLSLDLALSDLVLPYHRL